MSYTPMDPSKKYIRQRNAFAISKVSLAEVEWGRHSHRILFYKELQQYHKRFGNWPSPELFETLWTSSEERV